MAINFPSSPTNGQQFNPSTGVYYTYDGTKWVGAIGTSLLSSNNTWTGNNQFTRLGIGTSGFGANGSIRATNDITAYYSDERLKVRLGNIPEALNKVNSLSGFYFHANELAQTLGYEKKDEVGVSAQEVSKVLPEVVVPAPIDEKYLTVKYEKIIPLLIEAIKELNNNYEHLKKLLDDRSKSL